MPLRELVTVLRRRRRTVLWVVVVLTSFATLIGLRSSKTYTATAQVMIEPREQQIINVQKVAQSLPAGDSATIETQIKVIQSRETLERAVGALDLTADPELTAARVEARQSVGGPLGTVATWLPDWLAERLGPRWAAAAGVASIQPIAPNEDVLREETVSALANKLKVTQAGLSYVLSISYTASSPDAAARIANGVANAYIEGQLDDKLSTTRRASTWLAEQVEDLRAQVIDSENAVQAYRTEQGLIQGNASLDGQQLAVLTTSMIDARAESSAKEARLRHLKRLQQGGGQSLESAADVLASPLIVSLREREMELQREQANLSREYGERHPLIVQRRAEQEKLADRMRQEVRNVIANLENEIAIARTREEALREHLGEVKGNSALTGQAEVQLRELEREAAANRAVYETFLTRLKETEQQQEIVQADARLISPAQVPNAPSSPPTSLFAMVGFTASVVAGSLLAILLEQLDNTLRSARQAEELLGLRALGTVPKVADTRDGPLHGLLSDMPGSAYALGVQAVYTQLRWAKGDRLPRTLLITSALPGEGKTSIAASLASCAAQLGRKTLLIDLDLRRPAVGREFGTLDSGVVEVLEGQVPLERAIYHEQGRLDILAAVGGHDNPVTLLTGDRLKLAMRQVASIYDQVIVDAPPVLGVPDAKALASLVDAVLFVVQWDRTKRDAAIAAVKELEDSGASLAGVVLSQVDLKKHAAYGYGDAGQYYHEYRKYYQTN